MNQSALTPAESELITQIDSLTLTLFDGLSKKQSAALSPEAKEAVNEVKDSLKELDRCNKQSEVLKPLIAAGSKLDESLKRTKEASKTTKRKTQELSKSFAKAIHLALQEGSLQPDSTCQPLVDAQTNLTNLTAQLEAVEEGSGFLEKARSKAKKLTFKGKIFIAKESLSHSIWVLAEGLLKHEKLEDYQCDQTQESLPPFHEAMRCWKEAQAKYEKLEQERSSLFKEVVELTERESYSSTRDLESELKSLEKFSQSLKEWPLEARYARTLVMSSLGSKTGNPTIRKIGEAQRELQSHCLTRTKKGKTPGLILADYAFGELIAVCPATLTHIRGLTSWENPEAEHDMLVTVELRQLGIIFTRESDSSWQAVTNEQINSINLEKLEQVAEDKQGNPMLMGLAGWMVAGTGFGALAAASALRSTKDESNMRDLGLCINVHSKEDMEKRLFFLVPYKEEKKVADFFRYHFIDSFHFLEDYADRKQEPGKASPTDEIRKFADLLKDGLISEEEFNEQKKRLLD
ncbi:SHOCT domain-containing protein [Verrucomicrobia bacterium]|nr:SHOCT domain-containing protein [Verrucomicrobiota bacterium]